MAAEGRPATPITSRTTTPVAPPPSSAPSTPQPGTWQHPKFDEIARRQNAQVFSDRNMRQLLYNACGLVAFWTLESFARSRLRPVIHVFDELHPVSTYTYRIIQILLVFNILVALRPLFRAKDDLSDIPLTPAQRRLLGLPSSDKPPKPGAQYVTPPRYPRSSTPSGSPSTSFSASPLSAKANSAQANSTPGSPRGSPFSPFSPAASPLLSKAIGGGLLGPKRTSLSSPSPLGGRTTSNNWLGTPTASSPTPSKGPSVTLNNKWIWNKGRRASGDSRVFS